jgi:hypothetical protein
MIPEPRPLLFQSGPRLLVDANQYPLNRRSCPGNGVYLDVWLRDRIAPLTFKLLDCWEDILA